MVMIVEKPGVNVALAQSLLDGREVHIQTVILHDRWRRADTPVRRLSSCCCFKKKERTVPEQS
jgi:hypothetical protein